MTARRRSRAPAARSPRHWRSARARRAELFPFPTVRGRAQVERIRSVIYEVTVGTRRLRVELGGGRGAEPPVDVLIDDAVVAADVREVVRGRQWSIALDGATHEITLLLWDPMRFAVDGIEIGRASCRERV